MNIIATVAFGPTFLSNEEVHAEVHGAFERALKGVQDLTTCPHILRMLLMREKKREVQKDCARIRKVVHKAINDRRKGLNKAAGGRDLLDILVSNSDSMSDETMVDEAVTFVFAAYETTANAFQWLFYYLGKYCCKRVLKGTDAIRLLKLVHFCDA